MKAEIIDRPDEDQLGNVAEVKRFLGEEPRPGDEELWILGQPLVVRIHDKRSQDNEEDVRVEPGFTTDGASVPPPAQLVTGWDPWEDPQRWAGVAHDWLYHISRYDRRRADHAFRAVLIAEGASRIKTTLMYQAVRIFGRFAYRRNQRWGWEAKIFRR